MALYVLVVIAILLIVMVTPKQAEYLRVCGERASKGGPGLPLWDDLSVNWVFW